MSAQIPMPFPNRLPVRKAVERGDHFTGSVSVQALPRVAEVSVSSGNDSNDSFNVELLFGRNDSDKPCVWLRLNGSVLMQCQRCLGEVAIPVESDAEVVFVAHDDEARSVLKSTEPWVLDEGMLDVCELLEEEILLALPGVAMHSDACSVNGYDAPLQLTSESGSKHGGSVKLPAATDDLATETQRPFDVLAKLKG